MPCFCRNPRHVRLRHRSYTIFRTGVSGGAPELTCLCKPIVLRCGLDESCWNHRQHVVQVDRTGCVQPCLATCPCHSLCLPSILTATEPCCPLRLPQSANAQDHNRYRPLPLYLSLSHPRGHETQQQSLNELSYLSISSFRFARNNLPVAFCKHNGAKAASVPLSLTYDFLS